MIINLNYKKLISRSMCQATMTAACNAETFYAVVCPDSHGGYMLGRYEGNLPALHESADVAEMARQGIHDLIIAIAAIPEKYQVIENGNMFVGKVKWDGTLDCIELYKDETLIYIGSWKEIYGIEQHTI